MKILATQQMIEVSTVIVGAYDVTIKWTVLDFPPQVYREKIMCKYLCSHDIQEIYKNDVKLFPSALTSSTINELKPGSRCVLRFHAVYNPATLDDGWFSLFTTESRSH